MIARPPAKSRTRTLTGRVPLYANRDRRASNAIDVSAVRTALLYAASLRVVLQSAHRAGAVPGGWPGGFAAGPSTGRRVAACGLTASRWRGLRRRSASDGERSTRPGRSEIRERPTTRDRSASARERPAARRPVPSRQSRRRLRRTTPTGAGDRQRRTTPGRLRRPDRSTFARRSRRPATRPKRRLRPPASGRSDGHARRASRAPGGWPPGLRPGRATARPANLQVTPGWRLGPPSAAA